MGLRYRPAIDGLRAVAVLAVLFFHAKFGPFKGGFIGVDVFFVISGFLITTLIHEDLLSGRFSLASFYARRIRRIFPALFVMVAFSTAAGFFLLLPNDYAAFGTSQIYTALFASNIAFWRLTFDYYSHGGLFPLLHTWSLSVEEQFYLVVPVAMVLVHRSAPKRTAWAAGAAAVASFALYLRVAPDSAFYLAPLRAWEFLAGSLLALKAVPELSSRGIRNGASCAGLGAVVWAAMAPGPVPSVRVIAAVGGAFLLLWAGDDALIGRALAATPLRQIGRISYSLYLWHWPVLVFFAAYLARQLTLSEAWGALATAALLSYLSWRFVETPFRENRLGLTVRGTVRSAAVASLVVLALGFAVRTQRGLPGRLSPELRDFIAGPTRKFAPLSEQELGRLEFRPIGASRRAPPTFVVWGDSHADAAQPAFDALSDAHGVSGFLAAFSSCPPVMEEARPGRIPTLSPGCGRFNHAVLEAVLKLKLKDAVLVARWSGHDADDPDFKAGLRRTLRSLERAGVRAWVLEQPPETEYRPQYRAARLKDWSDLEGWLGIPRPRHERTRAPFRKLLDGLASETPLTRIDPTARFCDSRRCRMTDGRTLLYRDSHHLNGSGAAFLRPVLEPIFARNDPPKAPTASP